MKTETYTVELPPKPKGMDGVVSLSTPRIGDYILSESGKFWTEVTVPWSNGGRITFTPVLPDHYTAWESNELLVEDYVIVVSGPVRGPRGWDGTWTSEHDKLVGSRPFAILDSCSNRGYLLRSPKGQLWFPAFVCEPVHDAVLITAFRELDDAESLYDSSRHRAYTLWNQRTK